MKGPLSRAMEASPPSEDGASLSTCVMGSTWLRALSAGAHPVRSVSPRAANAAAIFMVPTALLFLALIIKQERLPQKSLFVTRYKAEGYQPGFTACWTAFKNR